MRVTYIGHATVLLEMNGVRLLTDPVLRPRIFHLKRLFLGDALIPKHEISAVLISHTHRDHFDLPTLEWMGKTTRVILPRGEGDKLRKRGFKNVQEISQGDSIQVGSIMVEATHAEHGHRRYGLVRERDCLGFLVSGSRRVYFAGDTDLFPGMARIGENLDLALLPVWGWGPTLGPGHMDPRRAARALDLLKPRLAIPIHWGTYYPLGFIPSRTRFLIDPPRLFAKFAAELAPGVQVHILDPGERMSFDLD